MSVHTVQAARESLLFTRSQFCLKDNRCTTEPAASVGLAAFQMTPRILPQLLTHPPKEAVESFRQ